MYNYHVSLGGIFNIIDNAADNAKPINQSYDLSLIKDSTSDELFHWGSPILATVDIPSRFCAFLIEQGFGPEISIIDSAKGLTKGFEEALAVKHPPSYRCYRFITQIPASSLIGCFTR